MNEQEVFELMAIAKEQQKSAQAIIDSLAVERAELAKERAAFSQIVREIAPHLQKSIRDAFAASLVKTLPEVSARIESAFKSDLTPLVGNLSNVVKQAASTEAQLKQAGQWFAWKMFLLAFAGMAGVCLVAWGFMAWQQHQVELLQEEQATLQANVDALAKKGGRIKLETCGKSRRLCVLVDTTESGYGEKGNYYIIKGY